MDLQEVPNRQRSLQLSPIKPKPSTRTYGPFLSKERVFIVAGMVAICAVA